MSEPKTLSVTDRQQWRAWLEQYHGEEREIWLVFYKAHTGHPNIPYEDAVEEALCFGWIDSLIRKLDDDRYARKFTPRVNTAKWSAANIARAQKALREGRMTEPGMAVLPAQMVATPPDPRPKVVPLPGWVEEELRSHPAAWETFSCLPPSHRRNYIAWITQAKRPETQRRRLSEAIGLLEQGKSLGLK